MNSTTLLSNGSMSEMNRLLSFVGLRRMFYMVTPAESTYATVEEVPDYFESATGWFLLLVIVEWAVNAWFDGGKNTRYGLDDLITSANAGVFSMLVKVVSATFSLRVYEHIYTNYRLVDLDASSAWVWLLCFLTEDLGYYLGHRAIHEFGVLWSFHQMHHSSEYYNLSTALRQGCIQQFAYMWFETFQAFFIPTPVWMAHRSLNILYQFWLHTEIVTSLGPLEYVLNTPSHHRVHHGRNPYCIDKNYGGTLIIWDRLFGTFSAERPDEKIAYGLVTNVKSFNQIWLQFFEFFYFLYEKPSTMRGPWNKVKAVFMPPGWQPGSKTVWFGWWRMADTEDGIPEVDHTEERYTNSDRMPLIVKLYCFVQFSMLIYNYVSFSAPLNKLDMSTFALHSFHCVFHMQTIGTILDIKSYASLLELVRLLFQMTVILPISTSDSLNNVITYAVYMSIAGILANLTLSTIAGFGKPPAKSPKNPYQKKTKRH